MRKVTYYVACSVDRFIARENGSFEDFLTEGEHLAELVRYYPDTIPTHLRATLEIDTGNMLFDTVLMGRLTYEVGSNAGLTSPYSHLRQYVFSKTMPQSEDANVTLVSSDPLEFVETLKKEPGKGIWLCGGASLAAAIFPAIDELILKVNPIFLGTGIPLFRGPVSKRAIELASHKMYPNGFLISHYHLK